MSSLSKAKDISRFIKQIQIKPAQKYYSIEYMAWIVVVLAKIELYGRRYIYEVTRLVEDSLINDPAMLQFIDESAKYGLEKRILPILKSIERHEGKRVKSE